MSDEHAASAGAGHASTRAYVIGFILSIVLTAIPFALVMSTKGAHLAIIITIVVFAVVQIFVHLVFFLHMNRSSEQLWNRLAFAYTLILLGILVGGSIWIMFHLDYNMMIR